MAERPIIFSGPLVRRILADQKSQTRRLLTIQTAYAEDRNGKRMPWKNLIWDHAVLSDCGTYLGVACTKNAELGTAPGNVIYDVRVRPRVEVGDVLWVRENFAMTPGGPDSYPEVHFAANMRCHDYDGARLCPAGDASSYTGRWKPNIHMPRTACRLFLRATGVRIEPLQSITAEDAIAEGIDTEADYYAEAERQVAAGAPWPVECGAFANLWDSINGHRKGASWLANPFVAVTTFGRIEEYADA